MSKVIFGDVVRRANTKEDRHNTDKIYYVGGEHIESNEVLIENRGLIEGSTIGPMFYFGFKAGDVLFVSRNPHLRKAGMVTFDGICSEKTFVLETKDESVLLQRYLAFVMQSDHFWSYINHILPHCSDQIHRDDTVAADFYLQGVSEERLSGYACQRSLHLHAAFCNTAAIDLGKQFVEILALPDIVAAPIDLDVLIVIGRGTPYRQFDGLGKLFFPVHGHGNEGTKLLGKYIAEILAGEDDLIGPFFCNRGSIDHQKCPVFHDLMLGRGHILAVLYQAAGQIHAVCTGHITKWQRDFRCFVGRKGKIQLFFPNKSAVGIQ